MRVTAPYTYTASYIPFRARNPVRSHLASSVEIEIREMEKDQLKLAFVAGDRFDPRSEDGYTTRDRPFSLIDGRPPNIYELDGRLYAELFPAAELAEILEQGIRNPRNPFSVRGPDTDNNDTLAFVGEHSVTRAEINDQYPRIRLWNDDRAAKARRLEARAEELIIVDGVVCAPKPEPCYAVAVDDEAVRIVLTDVPDQKVSAFENCLSDWSWRQDRLWRIDRKDAALAQAQTLADAAGVPVIDETSVEFVAPEAVTFCDDGTAIRDAAHRALTEIEASLTQLDTAAGLAWYELRDALDESGGRLSPGVVNAMDMIGFLVRQEDAADVQRRALPSFYYGSPSIKGRYGAYKNRPYESGRHDRTDPIEEMKSAVTEALRRWDERPSDGREWVHHAMKLHSSADAAGTVHEVLTLQEARNLSRDLGVDLDPWAQAASQGDGHLLTVTMKDRPVVAALCEHGPAGDLIVKQAAGVNGRAAGPVAKRLLDNHLEQASVAFEDEAALSELAAT